MTTRKEVGLAILVLACGFEVFLGWLAVSVLLFAIGVALAGREEWVRHRGRGGI
jgi:hypothetical protein